MPGCENCDYESDDLEVMEWSEASAECSVSLCIPCHSAGFSLCDMDRNQAIAIQVRLMRLWFGEPGKAGKR